MIECLEISKFCIYFFGKSHISPILYRRSFVFEKIVIHFRIFEIQNFINLQKIAMLKKLMNLTVKINSNFCFFWCKKYSDFQQNNVFKWSIHNRLKLLPIHFRLFKKSFGSILQWHLFPKSREICEKWYYSVNFLTNYCKYYSNFNFPLKISPKMFYFSDFELFTQQKYQNLIELWPNVY